MPIIKPEKSCDLKKVKLAIDAEIINEIENYCEWVNIGDIGIFFKQAAIHILRKDKDWLLHKKNKK